MRYGQDVNKQLADKVRELRRDDDDTLYEAVHRVESDVEKLYWQAESIKRKAEEVMQRCENASFSEKFDGKFYLGVNSLGELQGRGTEIDIQCALVSRAIEDLNKAMYRAEKAAKKKAVAK